MSETRIVGDILASLNCLDGCYAWRNNTGGVKFGKSFVQFSEKGAADIIACYRGRFVAIECKTSTGRQSPFQKRWQASIERAGGTYVLARSWGDVCDALSISASHPKRAAVGRVFPR